MGNHCCSGRAISIGYCCVFDVGSPVPHYTILFELYNDARTCQRQTHNNIQYLLLFHCNNYCPNAPHFCVISTLPFYFCFGLVGPLPYPHIGYGFFAHNVRNIQNVDLIPTQHSCRFLTPACLIFHSISERFVN